jgi:hypothetical protein
MDVLQSVWLGLSIVALVVCVAWVLAESHVDEMPFYSLIGLVYVIGVIYLIVR